MLYSRTGECHGAGTERFKWVSRMTKAERQSVREGATVIVTNGASTHGGNPPFRVVVWQGGARFTHRVPPKESWPAIQDLLKEVA